MICFVSRISYGLPPISTCGSVKVSNFIWFDKFILTLIYTLFIDESYIDDNGYIRERPVQPAVSFFLNNIHIFFCYMFLFPQWIIDIHDMNENLVIPIDKDDEEMVHIHGEIYVRFLPPKVCIYIYIYTAGQNFKVLSLF